MSGASTAEPARDEEAAPLGERDPEKIAASGRPDPATAPPSPPKLDPETLAIRTRPTRAIRIRRDMVIGLSILGLAFVLLTAWAALHHASPPKISVGQDPSQQTANAAGDTLNGLPGSYGDVPKVGPPLPGDLGKPMLDQQQHTIVSAPSAESQRPDQAAEPARQQRQAEVKAARESGLLVNAAAGASSSQTPTPAAGVTSPTVEKPGLTLDPEHDPNGQGRKADFVTTLAGDKTVNPHALCVAPSPYLLSAGSIVSASLITGLRSDLPGMVTAQVTDDVYDSPTGRILLVPQGARLIGKYDSVVAFGQKRALVVWQRIVLPDGSSVSLDNMPATDPAGYAGLQDKVDFHTWQLLKGVAISTLLGVGSDLQFSGNGGLVEAIRQSATQNVSRAGDQLTSKALDIQPTLTIRPGAPVRLIVDRDLVLAPWHG